MLTYAPSSTRPRNETHRFFAIWKKLQMRIRHLAGSISSFLRKELWLLEETGEHTQDRNAILFTGMPRKDIMWASCFSMSITPINPWVGAGCGRSFSHPENFAIPVLSASFKPAGPSTDISD